MAIGVILEDNEFVGSEMMLKAAATFSCLLFLPACDKPLDQRTLDEAFRENSSRATVAVDALKGFRESFNSGKCNPIYVEAADVFRLLESQDDWLTTCEQARARLGYWMGLDVRTTEASRDHFGNSVR